MLNWIVWNRTVWSSMCKKITDVELLVLNSNTWKHVAVWKQMINRK